MTRADLDNKLLELLELQAIPNMVRAQVDKYVVERGWSYLEIARAVAYLTLVRKQKLEVEKYGIGLVPLVMEEAKQYFKREKEKREAQELQAKRLLKNKNNYDIICNKPKKRKAARPKEIDLNKLNEDGNE